MSYIIFIANNLYFSTQPDGHYLLTADPN